MLQLRQVFLALVLIYGSFFKDDIVASVDKFLERLDEYLGKKQLALKAKGSDA